MELKSTRRIVTGHDSQGKAVVLFDSALEAKQRSAGGNGMTLLWVTSESPVDAGASADRSQTHVGVPPPANGTVFRIVDFAPLSPQSAPVDHEQILRAMGMIRRRRAMRAMPIRIEQRRSTTPSFLKVKSTCCWTIAQSM